MSPSLRNSKTRQLPPWENGDTDRAQLMASRSPYTLRSRWISCCDLRNPKPNYRLQATVGGLEGSWPALSGTPHISCCARDPMGGHRCSPRCVVRRTRSELGVRGDSTTRVDHN